MMIRLFLVTVLLSGCTPFIGGGVYYSFENGDYTNIDEDGVAGTLEIGLATKEERWYTPSECGYYHRTMIFKRPEIATDDIGCKKRYYFR